MSKWTWARDEGQGVWMNGIYKTKDSAICGGRDEIQAENKEFELENRKKFYVGKINRYIPAPPDADVILEKMDDEMCDQFQSDIVEDYMISITIDDVELLQEKLDKAWNSWIKETENYPNLFEIIEVEEVNVYSDNPGQQKGEKK